MDKKVKKQENEYPRFLDNKPCGQDLFVGKSHDSVAQNIANIIASNKSNIIGIDGGWGSGKSNMVKLVKDKLKLNSDNYHFFIYDAWGHQTDFQRRSILENLTSFLVDDEKILDKEKWNARLLQLLSRKRSIGTKIVKELSAVSKVGAVFALVSPLLVLINSFIEKIGFKCIYWIVIFLFTLFVLYKMQIKNMKKYGQPTNLPNVINELFFSYLDYTNEKEGKESKKNNVEQSIKYETIYDEEPSTRDFKNWMKDIDKDIKNHTLIIVFDNMDRLPREKVQELWSAIHTFFAEEKYDNISVIVPFDREHVKAAFKSEDIISEQQNDDAGVTVADENKKKKKNTKVNKIVCFGNDFINKTFDAVYRVSPPIMSDWKDYFANRWEEAFGTKLDSKVTQIYDLLSETITPREIIAFINEVVAIKQISDNSIPNEYIALFVKGKDIISACPEEEILHPSYLGALDFMYKNDTELPKYISALYYQLPVDKALDIIYTDNLKRALDIGEEEQIKSIQRKPQLFFLVLENAITKVTNISNAVKVLNVCLSKDSSQQEQMIWDCIYENIKQQPINDSLQEYQRILLNRITDKDKYLQTIVSALCDNSDIDVLGYYDSIKLLSEDGFNPFIYLHEKEYSPESFLFFAKQAKDDYKRYKIVCGQEELNKYLSGLDVNELNTLSVIPYIKYDYDVSPYLNHLVTLVDSNINNKESIVVLYTRLKELERPVSKKLPDAQIQVFFNQTKDTEDFYYDLICMRISRLNNFHANLRPAFKAALDLKEDDFVERVAERIEYYINFGDILLNVETMSSPLYLEVAKKLTEKSYGSSTMDVAAVIQKYDTIKNNLEITPDMFIKRIDAWCDDVKTRITEDKISSIPVEFFNDIKTIDSNVSLCCIKTAISYLNSKSKEEWKQSMLAGNFEYQLLMIIKPNIQACFDAFKELLVENVQANNNAFSKDKCGSLIELLESNGREMLTAFNNVRDCFCGGTYIMTNDIFSFYGEWLLKYAKLEEKPSALRTIFTPAVLDNKENIQLILKYQEKMVNIVEMAGDENNDFKEKIKSLLDGEYKDDDDFEAFAKAIGINKSIIDKLKDSIGI